MDVPQQQQQGGARGGHRMELRGLLPPWVLQRLCRVLADTQEGQFQVCRPSLCQSSCCICSCCSFLDGSLHLLFGDQW
jgi:hypothetical protein